MKKTGNCSPCRRRAKSALFLRWLIAGFLLLLHSPLSAEMSVSASVDKTKAALNDSIRLMVIISGSGNIPDPRMPDLSNFTVYSSGRSQNISFVNGQMSSSVTHTYILTPRNSGALTIGPFSVTVEGKNYQTQPIQIEVGAAQQSPQTTPASAPRKSPSSQPPGAFVTLSLDKPKAYLNEQVTLTFRFYCRVSLLANPEYKPPDATGFLVEDLPPPKNFTDTANGVQYHVTEVKTALFPTRPGPFTIRPPSLKIRVEDVASNPFNDDFFQSFFRGAGREYLLSPEPVHIAVLPLPAENKPRDFSGGVGEFAVAKNTDKSKLGVGDSLTLTVSINGTGNIKSLGDPAFPPFSGFRKYDTASSLNLDKSKGRVEGSKVYKIILVPLSSGLQTIPSISFSFFDLSAKKYRTVATPPTQLEILPGKSTGTVISPFAFSTPEIQKMQQDIRYIKTGPLPGKSFSWITENLLFIPLNLLPLLGLLTAGLYRWRKYYLGKNPEKMRCLNAYKKAQKELKTVSPPEGAPIEQTAAKIFDILRNYFADKMMTPLAGLTSKKVQDYLTGAKVPEETALELSRIWNELEIVRYAPSQFRSVDMLRIFQDASLLLQKIDEQLEKSVPLNSSSFLSSPPLKTILFMLSLSLCAPILFSAAMAGTFEEANQFYQEGRFENALGRYEEMENSGFLNFSVEYNTGNSCYKLGQTGPAIAHWMRAWRMGPRDSDVRYNLSLATSRAGDPVFPDFFFLRWLKVLFYFLNLNELSIMWLLTLWSVSAWWIRVLVKGHRILTRVHLSLFAILILMFGWWSVRYQKEQKELTGVVAVIKSEVRSGPGSQFGVGFTIPEGRRIIILNQPPNSDWAEVGVPREGLKGWVMKSDIIKI